MSMTNPFLAARPYGPAEADMFFGRQAASVRLAERIDLNPFVILIAPSGIGKTSLLRAAIMPDLERRGLSPVYLRPDPTAETAGDGAAALLDGRLAAALGVALLPDATLEQDLFELLSRLDAPDVALPELRHWFRGLGPAHESRQAILTPAPGRVERISQAARVLSGTFTVTAFAEQWRHIDPRVTEAVESGATRSRLEQLFADPELIAAARANQQGFGQSSATATQAGLSADSLVPAVQALASRRTDRTALIRPDGDTDLLPRIVLVIDQFEQMFTLSRPQTRERAFALLSELLASPLPLHLVLSLRKEWFADLVRQLESGPLPAPMLDRATFHLEPMTQAEASEVMIKVPKTAGLPEIPADRRNALWDALQVDGSVDAVVLSIACHELYAGAAERSGDVDLHVDDLLAAYLDSALSSVADPADHDEALDILGEIVGAGSGVARGFVTQTQLLSAPLRDRGRRQRVLEDLQKRFLIKGDSPRRGADKVYDVMHERLLDPMRKLVAERPDIAAAREAAERAVQRNATRAGLSLSDCRALLACRHRISIDPRVAGILLRSLLEQIDCLSDTGFSRIRETAELTEEDQPLEWWRGILLELTDLAASPSRPSVSATSRFERDWWMSAEEIENYLAEPEGGDGYWLALASTIRGTPSSTNRWRIEQLAQRVGAS